MFINCVLTAQLYVSTHKVWTILKMVQQQRINDYINNKTKFVEIIWTDSEKFNRDVLRIRH